MGIDDEGRHITVTVVRKNLSGLQSLVTSSFMLLTKAFLYFQIMPVVQLYFVENCNFKQQKVYAIKYFPIWLNTSAEITD